MIIKNQRNDNGKYQCPFCNIEHGQQGFASHFENHFETKKEADLFLIDYYIGDTTCAWCGIKITKAKKLKPTHGDFSTGAGELCCSAKCGRALSNRVRFKENESYYRSMLKKQSDAQRDRLRRFWM